MGQSLLQTGGGILKWNNSIKKQESITKQGGFMLLQSGARAITKWDR